MNRTSNVRKQNSSGHFSPKSPDCLPNGSGSHIRIAQKTCEVSELVTHYRMHTYRPGNLRDAQAHIRAVVQRNNNNTAHYVNNIKLIYVYHFIRRFSSFKPLTHLTTQLRYLCVSLSDSTQQDFAFILQIIPHLNN
jgi:hypothetical protein